MDSTLGWRRAGEIASGRQAQSSRAQEVSMSWCRGVEMSGCRIQLSGGRCRGVEVSRKEQMVDAA